MTKFSLIEETIGYVTAEDKTNTDPRNLVSPSQNVLIDRQRKVSTRNGYKRRGGADATTNPVRSQLTWHNSTGGALEVRNHDVNLEVYLETVDTVSVDAWTSIDSSRSSTEKLRFATWWDDDEVLDVLLWVEGDDNIYEWSGGVAVLSSGGTNTLTKKGTNTWSQNRFYNARDRTIINTRTGVEFAYTGGDGTTTLTGVTPDPAGEDVQADDVFIQKIVTSANEPEADRNNHTIFNFENHILIGSDDENEVFMTNNDNFTDTTFSSPRVAGEGGLFTLDGPSRGFGVLGDNLVLFAGNQSIFKARFTEITVSTTLAEVISVDKVLTGDEQGSFSADTIIQLGNALIYLSNEPALRFIQDPNQLEGIDPKTLSNPIKPDFDAETWTNAEALWFRNGVYLSSPTNSKLYILQFVEDADGRLRRFWQPPQVLPVRSLSSKSGALYTGSNGVAETYELFESSSFSDINSSDEKIPIHAIAAYAYRNFDERGRQKVFDEYFVEGEISPNTDDLQMTLNYNFGGALQSIDETIDGTNEDILEETLENASLGQQALAQIPLGGASSAPSNTRKFRVIFEEVPEPFLEIQAVFSTNDLDRYWSIISNGPNARLSKVQLANIKI